MKVLFKDSIEKMLFSPQSARSVICSSTQELQRKSYNAFKWSRDARLQIQVTLQWLCDIDHNLKTTTTYD